MLAAQKHAIVDRIQAVLAPLVAGSDVVPTVTLERPKIASHGDFACNVAMQIAKRLKQNPRAIAQTIVDALVGDGDGLVERAEIAGPGFVNLFLAARAHQAVVATVLSERERFGRGTPMVDDG
jgi:arginyl-tRNA synthetase